MDGALLNGLKPDEKLLCSKVLSQAYLSSKNNMDYFSDFLDPSKILIVGRLLKKTENINFLVYGGKQNAERQMIGICPSYRELEFSDFPISALKVSKKHSNRFVKTPSHRDYLGSILALGIKREKVGDIILLDESAYIFLHSPIKDYVSANLEKVSKTCVICEDVQEQIVAENTNMVESRHIVTSLRADCVISAAFHMSRSKSQQLIQGEKLLINYNVTNSTSQTIKVGDIITLRGFGRIRLKEICGLTKKDRVNIIIEKYT